MCRAIPELSLRALAVACLVLVARTHACTSAPSMLLLPLLLAPPPLGRSTQDDLYRPNHYQSMLDFREQTLQRLKKFVDQRFFSVKDYIQGEAEGGARGAAEKGRASVPY